MIALGVPDATDWLDWHTPYANSDSPLSRRLVAVKAQIGAVLDEAAGRRLRMVSLCAGDGRDVLETLAELPRQSALQGRLVELNPELCARARAFAEAHDLTGIDVVCADAGMSDVYAGALPADLVLLCGVLGNINDGDVRRMVRALPQFCASGGRVIWTRHRRAPDLTPQIRSWLSDEGFHEHAFVSPGPDAWSVGAFTFHGSEQPLRQRERLFTFIR